LDVLGASVPKDASSAQTLEDERRLIAEAQAGDMTALRPVFARYADPLYGAVILPLVRSPAAAEDVLRDTFVTALEKIRAFRWEGKGIYAWLRQSATHKAYDLHRRAQRTARVLTRFAEEPSHGGAQAADEALIAEEDRRRAAARIAAAMEKLVPRYQTALRLRLIEERSREECARELGVTVPTFDVLLFRAVRSFRKQLEETP
jgi:RNA polymerase sigma-70 factor (ECF subfamily)